LDYISNLNNSCDYEISKQACINNTTGPKSFSEFFIIKSKNKNNKILILPSDYLEPCMMDKCNITKNTVIKHIHEGSWFNKYQLDIAKFYLKNQVLCERCIILIFIIIIVSIVIGVCIKMKLKL
jgi:hypothetical protein